MASIATTFTARDTFSVDLALAPSETLNVIVTRTGSGAFSVQLEERIVGSTYAPITAAITADTAGTTYENITAVTRYFRLRCGAIVGGDSIATTLADVAGESIPGYPVRNAAGTAVLDVTDEGIETPKVTATSVVGNLTGNASGTAATVTTAAQPAITSVGTLTSLAVGAVTGSAGALFSSPTLGIGYATGAGGAQTQATNKQTTVVSNTVTTAITMHAEALNLLTITAFTFTNSTIAATDTVICTHRSGGTSGAYTVNAFPGAGSAVISVRNNTAGSLAEAIVLRVTVIKSVSA